jgi:hypothetical protein
MNIEELYKIEDKVKEINKLLYDINVILYKKDYEIIITRDAWGNTIDGVKLEKIPQLEIKLITKIN